MIQMQAGLPESVERRTAVIAEHAQKGSALLGTVLAASALIAPALAAGAEAQRAGGRLRLRGAGGPGAAARMARGWNAKQVTLPLEKTLETLDRRRRKAQIAARHALVLG